MPTTKKVAAEKARRAAPDAVAAGTTTTAGGAAGGLAAGTPAGTTAGPAGGLVQGTVATTATTGFGVLGFFTVDAEGATVRFGIDQQQYFLDASAANYNALFAMLLACWLESRKVDLTYAVARLVSTATPDASLRILSLVTI